MFFHDSVVILVYYDCALRSELEDSYKSEVMR